jgi:hypothetical protein
MPGFHLVPLRMNFGRTAWQDIQYYRAQRAQFVQDSIALMGTASSSIESALQNQLSGSVNNAAQVALNRLNALQAASSSSQDSQLQSILSQLNASSTSTSGSTVNTVA